MIYIIGIYIAGLMVGLGLAAVLEAKGKNIDRDYYFAYSIMWPIMVPAMGFIGGLTGFIGGLTYVYELIVKLLGKYYNNKPLIQPKQLTKESIALNLMREERDKYKKELTDLKAKGSYR